MADDRPTVLVVEDDDSVRALVEMLLTDSGVAVTTARDGLEGLLKLSFARPAAVVLDIMMPDVSGMRVLDELAAQHDDIPVVVVTGKPEAAAEARRRLGDENVFDKPFDPDHLIRRITQIVGT
ncbi:response regulator [Euzebya sp.]|uniref:response regulator n=1 Tax=Euzebya sp. TaxID=1971409 RepID=UPI0035168AB8